MKKFGEIAIITSPGIRNVNNIRNVYRNQIFKNHETYQTIFRQENVKSNKLRCLLLGYTRPIFIFKARLDTSKGKASLKLCTGAHDHLICYTTEESREIVNVKQNFVLLISSSLKNSRKWKLIKMKTSRKSNIFHRYASNVKIFKTKN